MTFQACLYSVSEQAVGGINQDKKAVFLLQDCFIGLSAVVLERSLTEQWENQANKKKTLWARVLCVER